MEVKWMVVPDNDFHTRGFGVQDQDGVMHNGRPLATEDEAIMLADILAGRQASRNGHFERRVRNDGSRAEREV